MLTRTRIYFAGPIELKSIYTNQLFFLRIPNITITAILAILFLCKKVPSFLIISGTWFSLYNTNQRADIRDAKDIDIQKEKRNYCWNESAAFYIFNIT